MSARSADRSTRLIQWWAGRYTAGLDPLTTSMRHAEIDSDLAEHEQYRRNAGWPTSRLARERLRRALVGVPADVGWRRDRLRQRSSPPAVASPLGLMTTAAQLVLAAYFFAFAAYLLGSTGLADQQLFGRAVLGGFDNYADAGGQSTAAVISGSLGLVLAVSAVVRSISPMVSNAATIPVAGLGVLFFWMGVWPLALVVLGGALVDLTLRTQQATPR